MSKGIKHDQEKPRLDLLPYEALEQVAKVLTFGASKYGKANWSNGIEHSRLLAAAMRHLGKYSEGENVDPESGLPHIAHATCNLVFLLWMSKNRPDLDDRWERKDSAPIAIVKQEISADPKYSHTVQNTLAELSHAWGPGKFGSKL